MKGGLRRNQINGATAILIIQQCAAQTGPCYEDGESWLSSPHRRGRTPTGVMVKSPFGDDASTEKQEAGIWKNGTDLPGSGFIMDE